MAKAYTPVNKKLIGLFILLGIFGCGGRQNSSSTTTQQLQQDTSLSLFDNSLLAKQVGNVKTYISSLSHKDNKLYLVLGVNNEEKDLLERFNNSYIFLNIEHQNPTDPRSLTADFNDLTQLQGLAAQLPDTFDKIILDDSTFKFTAWTKEHLAAFRDLLKVNGEFIFAPQFGMVPMGQAILKEQKAALQEAIELVIEQTQPGTSKILITGGFTIPLNFTLKQANIKAFTTILLRQVFVEDNYVRILTEAFGTGNIQVAYDTKLPFTSHWSKDQIQPVLIMARRK